MIIYIILLWLLFCNNLIANENSSFVNFLEYILQQNKEIQTLQNQQISNYLEISIPEPKKNLDKADISLKQEKSDIESLNKKNWILFPTNLEPYPQELRNYKFKTPDFIQGLYINNVTPHKKNFISLVEEAKKHQINTLVIDVQPRMIPKKTIEILRSMDFYLIARIVVFEQGFKKYPPTIEDLQHINSLIHIAKESIENGFQEIQLDYIRFSDNYYAKDLTFGKRYRFIAGILKIFEDQLRPYGIRLGADIFGRISFYKDDYIGQKLEIFDKYLDHIHPMLYPSHFYGMNERINNPYQTIYDGIIYTKQRLVKSKVIPYIQAFKMSIKGSGLSYKDYIKVQILACKDAKADGFIAWNIQNDYKYLFIALEEIFTNQ